MARVVLVTGASRYLGARVAGELRNHPGVDRVIGVDWARPRHPLGRAEFVATDLHDDSVGRIMRESGADTVLHLGFSTTPGTVGGTSVVRENEVLGAMQVLAACQRSATVRRVVVRSSAAVYGSAPRGPEGRTAEGEAAEMPRYTRAHDVADVERHTQGLARRRPDLSVAVLRFANFIGPSVETPLTRYLDRKVVPTMRGHDPRMQFIHEDDGVEAVRRVALGDAAGSGVIDGVFNVAAPGALSLSQCLRRAGRTGFALPERGLRVLDGLTRRARFDYSPERLRLLCYDRVLDFSKLERALGWTPSYTSEQAFDSFLAERGAGVDLADLGEMHVARP